MKESGTRLRIWVGDKQAAFVTAVYGSMNREDMEIVSDALRSDDADALGHFWSQIPPYAEEVECTLAWEGVDEHYIEGGEIKSMNVYSPMFTNVSNCTRLSSDTADKGFSLSDAIQLLRNEIVWCYANPDDEESTEYQRGFVAGIGHVALLLRAVVEVTGGDARSSEVDAFLLWVACAKAYEIMDHTEGTPDWKSKAMRVLSNAIESVAQEE